MRTIWLALVPVVLGVGPTAYGQQARMKKAKQQSGAIWAVSYQEGKATPQPLAPPVTNAVPGTTQSVPMLGHPVPIQAGLPEAEACCPEKCGKCARVRERCRGVLDFFCYRRSRSCAKDFSGCYFCHPPLYVYFLGHPCHEGACYGAQVSEPKCKQAGCWGKCFSAGHAMFAMPTGHGVCGVR